ADAALEAGDVERAERLYRQALAATIDYVQLKTLRDRLASLGKNVDLRIRAGVPGNWHIAGPFAGHEMTGFDRAYPPETNVDLAGEYEGDSGPIRWQAVTSDADGKVDLNGILGVSSDTVAYAYSEIEVPEALEAELRAGADDNLVIWLNGRRVFAFPHYHQHFRPDRHRVSVRLSAGTNALLLKVCQSPTPPDQRRPNNWEFLLRVVDTEGRPLEFADPTSPAESR
ncbi:MAG: hypothetical protein ABIK89_06115, partial [Planctomycetota bacterium]